MNEIKHFYLLKFDIQGVPWWKRLGAVLAIPYHLCRFVITGKVDFCEYHKP